MSRVGAFPHSSPKLLLDRLTDRACSTPTFAEVSLQGGCGSSLSLLGSESEGFYGAYSMATSNPDAANNRFSGIKTDTNIIDMSERFKADKTIPREWEWAVNEVREKGYVVLENLLSREEIAEIRTAIEPLLGKGGRNNFEGYQTRRVYAVLSKTRALDSMIAHPVVMALLGQFLMPNFLLTAAQVIDICPGESIQPLHYDDQFTHVPRPRDPFSMATVWALDDNFTAENGATVVIPKSHKWGDDRIPDQQTVEELGIAAELPIGSCVFFSGTLWHGGGANKSKDTNRCAFTAQYCQPWVRPQENMMLSVPFDQVAMLPPEIQVMAGYSIHPPFIGHDASTPRVFQKVGGGAFIYRLGPDRWCLGPGLYGQEIIWAWFTCPEVALPSSNEHAWESNHGRPEVYITRSSIFIIQGVGLRAADLDDNSNPYVVCKVSGKPHLGFRTQTRFKSLDPVWHEWIDLEGLELGDTMHFKVFSQEDKKDDEFLGEAKIVVTPGGYDGGVSLILRGRKAGTLRLELTVPPVVQEATATKKQVMAFDSANPREVVHCMTWGTVHESLQAVVSMESLLTSDDVRSRFVAAGAVQPLVAMLSDVSLDTRCKAAKALANLGRCAVGKRILVTTGGVPAVMKLVTTDDPECQEAAMAVLVHVAAGEKAREELIAGGVPPYLTALLDSCSPTSLAHAVRLLGYLAANQAVASMVFEGFLGKLLALLDNGYPDEVNLPAAFAIAQLASTDSRRRALVEAHIVQKTLRLLNEGSHDCKAEAAAVLASLAETKDKRTFKKITGHLLDAGVLTPILAMLSSSHEACSHRAERVLLLLAATARSAQEALTEGILRHLVEQLRSPITPLHAQRVARVLQALARFKRTEMELELSQESGQELLLAALQGEHDRHPALQKAEPPRPPAGQTVLPILSKLKSGRKMLPTETIIRTPRKLPAGVAPLPPLHCFY
eukprot:s2156_g14.t1